MKGSAIDRRGLLAGTAAAALALGLRPGPAAAQSGDVVYWHHFAAQAVVVGFERVVELFGEAYPEIDLSSETIPNADFMQKFTAAVVADSRPDTTMVSAERFPDMHAMGGLVDLTDRIESWPRRSAFPDDRFESVSADGRIYGVPAFSFVNWVYYRKDWFEEAGIEEPPETMEDFLDAALKITDPARGRYGFGMRGGDGGAPYITDMMRAWGSPIVEDGEVALDRQTAIEAVRFYAELYTKHNVVPPSAPNDSYRQIMEGFKTGQTGMVWHHTGSLQEIRTAFPDGNFGTMVRPAGPAARIAQVSYLYNGLMSERNADAAWEWVSFWGEAEPSLAFLELTGYVPVATDVLADPRLTDDPIYAAATRTMEFGVGPLSFIGADGWERTVVTPEFQKILTGTSTVEDAVDQMLLGLERTLR